MGYEHIKKIMLEECPHIWAWWTEDIRTILPGEELIRKYKDARMLIKKELEDRILTEQKYFAEYELLCLLSGIREPLNFNGELI